MKPSYHQSNIVHYDECPHKTTLSFTHEIEQSKAMFEGKLLEYYVFQGKGYNGINPNELIARKQIRADTKYLNQIKRTAEYVKKIILAGDSFVHLKTEFDEYDLEGEADFIGEVLYKKKPFECIVDLKKTANISLWMDRKSKLDFLQAVYYPYILFEETGKHLPFMYIVVEPSETIPIIKLIPVYSTGEDFAWLKNHIDEIHNDIIRKARPSLDCLKGKWGKRCDYFQHCEPVREFFETTDKINFGDLL